MIEKRKIGRFGKAFLKSSEDNNLELREHEAIDESNKGLLKFGNTRNITTLDIADKQIVKCEIDAASNPPLKNADQTSFRSKFKRAVNKVVLKNHLEKDNLKKLMEGRDHSKSEDLQLFISPDSTKYTVLRYSRAICILVNLILIPLL